MNALSDRYRAVPGGFAPRVGKWMAGLDPLHAPWQIRVRMSADCNRLPDRQVRCGDKRRGHRRRSLADRDDMKSPRGENVGDAAIGERPRQHATGTHRVDARANDAIDVLPESGNGSRQ